MENVAEESHHIVTRCETYVGEHENWEERGGYVSKKGRQVGGRGIRRGFTLDHHTTTTSHIHIFQIQTHITQTQTQTQTHPSLFCLRCFFFIGPPSLRSILLYTCCLSAQLNPPSFLPSFLPLSCSVIVLLEVNTRRLEDFILVFYFYSWHLYLLLKLKLETAPINYSKENE